MADGAAGQCSFVILGPGRGKALVTHSLGPASHLWPLPWHEILSLSGFCWDCSGRAARPGLSVAYKWDMEAFLAASSLTLQSLPWEAGPRVETGMQHGFYHDDCGLATPTLPSGSPQGSAYIGSP